MEFNYPKICQEILKTLPQRQKEVIERRFGLNKNKERETLQKIGSDFGVSRERVRQIEADSFTGLSSGETLTSLNDVFVHFANSIKEKGGVKREDILLRDLGGNNFQNNVYFLLTLGEPFHRFPEDEDVFAFWALEKGIYQKIKAALADFIKELSNIKKPLKLETVLGWAKKEPSEFMLSSLEIAKAIEQGPLGEYGLITWPEIKPRGVRDATYLALKKAAKPLHFRQIAEVAGSLKGDFFRQREILPQTVHNELIRDERFILVGRGIYALREWGYEPGTVKDIVSKILREKKVPLSKEEIVQAVQKQRLVKANTILLNLSDKNYFSKDAEGGYLLKMV